MDIKYFDLHVNFGSDGEYSLPVDIPEFEIDDSNIESSVIAYANDCGLFISDGDEHFVDTVTEIDFKDFMNLNGLR